MKFDVRHRLRALGVFISRWWLPALTDPFVRTPGLMLCMTAMQTVLPYCFYGFVIHRLPGYDIGAMAILSEAVVASWCLLLPYCILRRLSRCAAAVWLLLAFVPVTLNWLTDYVLFAIYDTTFSVDIATVLVATDPGEGADFVSAYMSPGIVAGLLGCVALCAGMYACGSWLRRWCVTRMSGRGSEARVLSLALVAVAWTMVLTCPPYKCVDTVMRQKIRVFASLDLGHGIVPVHPDLVVDPSDTPDKIVVVLGESHCRSHSSLYGYGKHTQPLQEALAADSSLYVFTRPQAPALTTLCSIHRIIGVWNGSAKEQWYECLSFLEVASMARYRTLWLSNQSCKGVCDSPMAKIAEFCDIHLFTNDGMHGIVSAGFDAEVLPLIEREADSSSRDLAVIHLMGSHVDYSRRYPSSFKRFVAADYAGRPPHQRPVLADYDNSILYNDYVLSEIYKRYADTDAVVIYLSDHAQDLYDSSPDFKGHAKADVPASKAAGEAVPFTVWLSPAFRARHPRVAARIAAATSRPVALTDLTYTLMDLMGARFADNDDVAVRSFFRPL